MKKKSITTKELTLTALFISLIILLSFVPGLGYIPLGFMNATIVHIPVIIGAVLLGPKVGALLGLVFGVSSLVHNTIYPNLTSFVFSPFYSLGETSGNFYSVIISIVPRVLVGVVAYYVYSAIKKFNKENLALILAGFLGSMTNTLLVMGGIYIFFGRAYAAAREISYDALFGVITGVIGLQGVPEAIVASILTLGICRVLLKVKK